MIQLERLHKSFGSNKVLQGVSLKIAKGSSLVVIGGSGTGKSVILKCILGLMRVDQGQVFLEGKDMHCLLYTSPSPRDRTRSRMPSSA